MADFSMSGPERQSRKVLKLPLSSSSAMQGYASMPCHDFRAFVEVHRVRRLRISHVQSVIPRKFGATAGRKAVPPTSSLQFIVLLQFLYILASQYFTMAKNIVVAFDVYGTLLSTESIAKELAAHFGKEKGENLAALWRRIQLEYTWRLNSMRRSFSSDCNYYHGPDPT